MYNLNRRRAIALHLPTLFSHRKNDFHQTLIIDVSITGDESLWEAANACMARFHLCWSCICLSVCFISTGRSREFLLRSSRHIQHWNRVPGYRGLCVLSLDLSLSHFRHLATSSLKEHKLVWYYLTSIWSCSFPILSPVYNFHSICLYIHCREPQRCTNPGTSQTLLWWFHSGFALLCVCVAR